MASVNTLAYLGIAGPDIDAWKTYATDVLGLQVSPASTDDKLLLRMDDRVYRLFVEKGDPGFSAIGFEVKTRAQLDELGSELEAAGSRSRRTRRSRRSVRSSLCSAPAIRPAMRSSCRTASALTTTRSRRPRATAS